MSNRDLTKAALRGEPSYVWRAGQVRRLKMILDSAQEHVHGQVLENGCGVGMYVGKLEPHAGMVVGIEYDFERTLEAHKNSSHILNAAGEGLPFPDNIFDLVLSHEVLEHVQDDRSAVVEMVRTLKPGGRAVIFCPHRGYPFETHGIYWRGNYKFGNIPFVNWLPRKWRNQLAPHVKVYSRKDMKSLFSDLPIRVVKRSIIFGAYDNLIIRFGFFGKFLKKVLQILERTPLQVFGLSHFWVIQKDDVIKLPKKI